MDVPGIDAIKYAEPVGGYVLGKLQPPRVFRTLRIEPNSISYGPEVIPLKNVIGISMRTKPFANGTPARQLANLLAMSVVLLVIARLDTILFKSELYKFLVSFPTLPFLGMLLVGLILAKQAGAILLAVVIAIIVPIVAAIIGYNDWLMFRSHAFGDYYVGIKSNLEGQNGFAPYVIACLAAYASLSFLRFPWSWREVRQWFRFPYFPSMLSDLSVPQLAIEKSSGSTLWIELPVHSFHGPEDRELQAMFASRILAGIARQMNSPETTSLELFDLQKREVLTSDHSVIRGIWQKSGTTITVEEIIAYASFKDAPWPVVEREILLLWHELERIPAPEAMRMTGYLRMLQWFGSELAVTNLAPKFRKTPRLEDKDAFLHSKKGARKAIRGLSGYSTDQPLFWNIWGPYRTDGEPSLIPISERAQAIAAWAQARLDEIDKPLQLSPENASEEAPSNPSPDDQPKGSTFQQQRAGTVSFL